MISNKEKERKNILYFSL